MDIPIKLELSDDNLLIAASEFNDAYIGTRNDSNTQTLTFERGESVTGDIRLDFLSGGIWRSYNIGTEDAYIIPKLLTDTGALVLATYLIDDANRTEGTNRLSFKYRPGGISAYTLTFETNGGSAIDSASIAKGLEVDLSEYVTIKEGFTFVGWYSDSEYTNKVTTITLTQGTTIYARWAKYSVTFNTNGGSSVETLVLDASSRVNLANYMSSKNGYTLDGWYGDAELTTGPLTTVSVASNMIVYAKWAEV